eukprot:s2454_g5.t2
MAPSVSMAEGFALCCLAFRNLRSVRFQDILWEKHMGVSENGAYQLVNIFRPTGRLGDWVVEFAASTSLLKRWELARRANPDQES